MINEMDYGLFGMKMERRNLKKLTRMGYKMDYRLLGMKTDRRNSN
jgi:hypothetical protein